MLSLRTSHEVHPSNCHKGIQAQYQTVLTELVKLYKLPYAHLRD